jgi:hypothetical protein
LATPTGLARLVFMSPTAMPSAVSSAAMRASSAARTSGWKIAGGNWSISAR